MTRTQRISAIVLCALLALTAWALIACDHTTQHYGVTLNYDPAMGEASVTAPKEGDTYLDGEHVTVTVNPADGYVVQSVKVNGTEVSLTGGEYTFLIVSDTVIDVTFVADGTTPTPPIYDTRYSVRTAISPSEGGEITLQPTSDDGTYASGTYVTFTVTTEPHYEVTSVTLNGQSVKLSGQGKYTLRVEQDTNIIVTLREVYVLTLNEGEGSDISIEQEASDGKYAPGTRLTFSVNMTEGYILQAVRVNGEEVHPTGGVYALDMTKDMTVETVTDRPMTEELLKTFAGSVKFTGQLSQTNEDPEGSGVQEDDPVLTDISVVYDKAAQAVWFTNVFDGETVLDRVVTERDGYSVYVERSTDGKVVYTRPTDEQGQPIEESFALRRNPFDVMTAADFEYVGNGVWQLTDMDKASDHAYALTGVREEIEKFELLATGSTLTGVHIVSAINHTQQEIFGFLFNYYIRDEYTLTQDKNGAAVPADRFSDYTETEGHSELRTALDRFAAATSYSVAVSRTEQDETVTHNVYVADGVIWFEGEESYGYFRRVDGNIWRFVKQGNALEVGAEPIGKYESGFAPYFSPNGAALCLLEDKGNGEFALRIQDGRQLLSEDSEDTLGGLFAEAFALDQDQHEMFAQAHTVKVTVQGDTLRVEVGYVTYGLSYTLVFSDIGETTLPKGIDAVADKYNGAFAPEYVGMWIEEGTANRIDITLDTVRVNNVAATLLGGNATEGYRVSGDTEYTVLLVGGSLQVTYGGQTHSYRPQLCKWEMFVGQYTAWTETGVEYTLVITTEGISWSVEGTKYEPLAFEFNYYDNDLIAGYAFTMSVIDPSAADSIMSLFLVQSSESFDLLHFYGSATDIDLLFRTDDYRPDLSDFTGVYEGDGYRVEITEHGVTLTYNGGAQEGQRVDISGYVNQYQERFSEISFWVNGNKYYLQSYSELNLGWMDLFKGNEHVATVRLDGYKLAWDMYYGTYNGIAEDGTTYSAAIDADGIVLTIGGRSVTVQDMVFDYNTRTHKLTFIFNADGTEYSLQQVDSAYARLTLVVGSRRVDLKRSDFLYDLTEFVGSYRGVDGNTTYTVEITEHSVSVIMNGNSATVEIWDVNDGQFGPQIVLQISGRTYYLIDYYGMIFLQSEDGAVDVELTRL